MKKMYQKLTDNFDSGKINKKEWGFYLVAIVAAGLVELSILGGVEACAFPIIILSVLFLFLKNIFPVRPEK